MGVKGGSSPYQRIEYLEATGLSSIVTDYVPDGADIEIQTKIYPTGYTADNAWVSWFAAYTNDQSNCYRIARYNKFDYLNYVNCGSRGGAGSQAVMVMNTLYEIVLSFNKIVINGSSTAIGTTQGNANERPFWLFASATASYGFTGRFYYFKVYKDNTLVLDLIPVRIGTTGYMYDTVSGNLYGNVGTDAFVLGPDINE